MPQWTLQHEREFFKLAGFMLLARFQVMWDLQCCHLPGHIKPNQQPAFAQMSYLGYSDNKWSMRLLLEGFTSLPNPSSCEPVQPQHLSEP
jgi:hypothetical protein